MFNAENIEELKPNWKETQKNFDLWWKCENADRPVMRIYTKRDKPLAPAIDVKFLNNEEKYTNVEKITAQYKNFFNEYAFYAETYPWMDINLGAGSIALYVGAEPDFLDNSVWYKHFVDNWGDLPEIKYDPMNKWLVSHLEMAKKALELSEGKYWVNIPDLVEAVDILSAIRNPQDLCFDLLDEPEEIKARAEQLDKIYFKYFDDFYNILKGKEGDSSFCAFSVWGRGKTAKIQCDFSAMISPSQYREFVQESMREQCKKLGNSMYHLDGPDAIRHVEALMEIKELNALQWTNGAGNPDGGAKRWYPIYEKVRAANKGIWVFVEGDFEKMKNTCVQLINDFGPKGWYFHCSGCVLTEYETQKLIEACEKASYEFNQKCK